MFYYLRLQKYDLLYIVQTKERGNEIKYCQFEYSVERCYEALFSRFVF